MRAVGHQVCYSAASDVGPSCLECYGVQESGWEQSLGLWRSLPPGGVEVGRGKGWERPGPAVLVWRRGEDPPVPGSPSTRILTIGNNKGRTSLLVQWLRLCSPHSGGQSSIPGQETRSHMPQLKISHAARKIRSTILCAAMYIQLSQINSKKKKKKADKSQ